MRQPDINRVRKALEHLKAADTLLGNIKWENISALEDTCRSTARQRIQEAEWAMRDMINV